MKSHICSMAEAATHTPFSKKQPPPHIVTGFSPSSIWQSRLQRQPSGAVCTREKAFNFRNHVHNTESNIANTSNESKLTHRLVINLWSHLDRNKLIFMTAAGEQ